MGNLEEKSKWHINQEFTNVLFVIMHIKYDTTWSGNWPG